MDVLATDTLDGVAAVAGDAMAGPGDAHQALDVEVEEVAGGLVLVALDGRPRFQIGDAAEPGAAEDTADGGSTQAGLLCDAQPGPAFPPERLHLRDLLSRGGLAHPVRARAAVGEPADACSRKRRTHFAGLQPHF